MTTIAYRDGIMAADSRAYSGGREFIGYKSKLWKSEFGAYPFLLGVSSPIPGFGATFAQWIENGMIESQCPKLVEDKGFSAILVRFGGEVFHFEGESFMPSGPLTAPYFAVGSGRELALGAMWHGATARQAVCCGIEHDVWSGGPVETISF